MIKDDGMTTIMVIQAESNLNVIKIKVLCVGIATIKRSPLPMVTHIPSFIVSIHQITDASIHHE